MFAGACPIRLSAERVDESEGSQPGRADLLPVAAGPSARVDLEVLTLSETLNIETADVYESPLLVEVGHFADLTLGNAGDKVEDGATWYQWS